MTCTACPGGAKNPCSGHSDPPWECPNGVCVCVAGYHGADCSGITKDRGWAVILVIILASAMFLGLVVLVWRRWDGRDDDDGDGLGRGSGAGLLLGGGNKGGLGRGRRSRSRRQGSDLDPALRKKLLEACPDLQGMEDALSSLGSDAADWLIDYKNLELGKRIGGGASSLVFQGLYFDELVAIKKLSGQCDPALFGLFFRQEAQLLAKLHHPHVVRFYGVCYHQGDFFIVTQYCEQTLQRILQQHHAQGNRLAPEDLYRIAYQIANGMAYLHARHVVHRDLKPENILLDTNGDAKICDFGLSKLLMHKNTQMTVQVGTPAFMSPEMAHGDTDMNESVDVYSFGVLLWTLWTCQSPYYYLDVTPVQLLSRVVAGLRPRIDRDMPRELVMMMMACWHEEASVRPTFDVLVGQLRELLKSKKNAPVHGRRGSFVAASVYSPPPSPSEASPSTGRASAGGEQDGDGSSSSSSFRTNQSAFASSSSSSSSLRAKGKGKGKGKGASRAPVEHRPLLGDEEEEEESEGDDDEDDDDDSQDEGGSGRKPRPSSILSTI